VATKYPIQDPVEIYEVGANGENITIFSGAMTSIEVLRQGNHYSVTIKAKTHTYFMDNKLIRCSFQDKAATYEQVVRQVIAKYPDAAYIQIPDDRPTQTMLVQYDETDWAFLKRLASHFNTVLIPDMLGTSPCFWMGIR